jgi:hypothetical protein
MYTLIVQSLNLKYIIFYFTLKDKTLDLNM